MNISFFRIFAVISACVLSASALEMQDTLPGHLRFGDSTVFFHIRGTLADSASITHFYDSDRHEENSSNVRLRVNGQITDAFVFRAMGFVSSDKTSRDYVDNFYDPYDGLPYNHQGKGSRSWDTFTARSEYRASFGKLMGGVDYLEWGPAKHNKLTLRGANNNYRPWMDSTMRLQIPAPTPFFGFELNAGPVTYTQYSGKLYYDKHKDKYFHAHRLDLHLPAQITFGVSETIVYGSTVENAGTNPNKDADSCDRHFEWIYAAPFVPYIFAQHYVGDRDNTGLSFDISVKTVPHWEFYGELLWDDMKKVTSMFDDSWWGNKWGASIGLTTQDRRIGPFKYSWTGEFTQIEPWVYTHHMGASHQYSNYGQSFGSELGPNSRELYTQLDIEWKQLKISLSASNVAKDSAKGSNIGDIHDPNTDGTDRDFLADSTTSRYRELSGALTYAPFEWLWIRAGYSKFIGDYEGYRMEGSAGLTW